MKRATAVLLACMLFTAVGAQVDASGPGLKVGDTAPDFSLPSTTGEKIRLSQFRGKKAVLLEFYGADFSPV